MGVLLGLAPWLIYWVLVGNVPFLIAAVVALATAVSAVASRGKDRGKEQPEWTLGIAAVVTFALLVSLTVLASPPFCERWLLPLSNAGLLAMTLTSVVIGESVVRKVVVADQPVALVHSELFDPVVARLTWIWLVALVATTVSSAVPALVLRDASLRDAQSPLAFTCYWLVPFSLLAVAGIASRILLDRMTVGFGDAVRKTSFVAFVDLEIDQLHYLAHEHANREVGPGQEAYNVTVGATATPLVGDETRVSWPSTFKVRERRG